MLLSFQVEIQKRMSSGLVSFILYYALFLSFAHVVRENMTGNGKVENEWVNK